MRKRLLAALVLALAPTALLAEGETCEYQNPDHPSWNFLKPCTVQTEGSLLRASISNGSRFTIETGEVPSVNNVGAEEISSGESRCWRTFGAHETICVHPAGVTPTPAAPALSDMASGAGLDAGFGGGTSGFCRLESLASISGTPLENGPCTKRDNCMAEDDGSQSCLSEYEWKSGRITETAQTKDWTTLDGGVATIDDNGCLVDPGMGMRFCYSTKAPSAPPALAPVQAPASGG